MRWSPRSQYSASRRGLFSAHLFPRSRRDMTALLYFFLSPFCMKGVHRQRKTSLVHSRLQLLGPFQPAKLPCPFPPWQKKATARAASCSRPRARRGDQDTDWSTALLSFPARGSARRPFYPYFFFPFSDEKPFSFFRSEL